MPITKATQNVIEGITSTGSNTSRLLQNRFADVINVKDFGATGDGSTNDFAAIQAAINYYVGNAPVRSKLYFPAGTYIINSTTNPLYASTNLGALFFRSTEATQKYSYQIEFDQNATIKAGPNLKASMDAIGATGTQALIYVVSDFGQSTYNFADDNLPEFNLTGGTFDISNITPATYGVNCLSIGPKFGAVRINNTTFTHGVGPASVATINPSAGGDSSITCAEPEFISITNCKFIGAVDLGVYLTGTGGDANPPTSSLEVGRHAIVSGNYFYRCQSAIACKRWFEKTIISGNNIFECGDGIFAGVADGQSSNTGQKLTISSNIINKCQGNPIRITKSGFAVVSNNRILDYRKWISNGTTQTVVSNGNYGSAIIIEESSNFSITGNVVGFDAWTPSSTAFEYDTGIRLDSTSTNGIVIGNQINKCFKPIIEINSSTNNILNDNSISNCTTNYNDVITDEDRTDYIANSQTGFKYFGGLTPDYSIFSAIAANTEVARFTGTTNAINNLVFQNSIASNPVIITARGTDTSVDLQLSPKGIGAIRLQSWVSQGDAAVNGYFTVKDSAGNVRKIPTIA